MEILGMHMNYNPLSRQTMPHREPNRIAGTSPVNVGRWERLASLAIGGFILYRAVKRRNFSSLLFGGTGLSLLNRGVSGVCPMYNRYGLSSAGM